MATMLSDVTPRTRNVSVRVRVLHSWWHAGSGKDPMLELILADEEGGRMAASIRGKKTISQWQNVMTEGATVSIKTFTAGSNGTLNGYKYQPTSHKYKIVFSPNTIVRPILDYTGSRYSFYFTSFTDIAIDNDIKAHHCVDVIGCLVKLGDITTFKKSDEVEETKMMTLFGKYIEQMQDEVSKQEPNKPIVIILQCGKINEWRSKFSLIYVKSVANAFTGSRLFVNSDIEEVTDFLQRYDGSGPVERITASTQSMITDPADFFKDCGHVPLADYMTHEQDGSYVTYATIDSIDADETWWYSACKSCNKKVIQLKQGDNNEVNTGNGLKCPGCGLNPKSLIPKFKVYIRVVNDTGSTSLSYWSVNI